MCIFKKIRETHAPAINAKAARAVKRVYRAATAAGSVVTRKKSVEGAGAAMFPVSCETKDYSFEFHRLCPSIRLLTTL